MQLLHLEKSMLSILCILLGTIALAMVASQLHTDNAVSALVTDRTPVFRKPFDGFFPIISFFDHVLGDNKVTRTDNRTLAGSVTTCTQGYSCYDGHTGIDYGMSSAVGHVTIRAAAQGTIFSAGSSHDLCPDGVFRDALRVVISHDNGFQTKYWHLSSISINPHTVLQWTSGDTIADSEEVGQSGTTGCSTGEHLHFQITDTNDGNVDPYGFFGNTRQNSLFRSNTLIHEDDNGFERFSPNNSNWFNSTSGDGGHSYFTYSINSADYQNWAIWAADIPSSGQHEVFAFVPDQAEATGITYKVMHRDGVAEVQRDQSNHRGQWMSLGIYTFDAHGPATVLLSDYSTGPVQKKIFFDTVKMEPLGVNRATVTDIPNPDAYSCSQPGYIDFESFTDTSTYTTNLTQLTIPGLQFTLTPAGGFPWLVGDFASGKYNGKYPNGAYTSHGTHWAWLGVSQGAGRIDFTKGLASYFSVLVSDFYPVSLDAYGTSGNLLTTAGPSPNNVNTGRMTELKITRAAADMAYVIIHDQGNFWEIDDVCTNAPGTPKTAKGLTNQTYSMQTGQHVSGNFLVDFLAGFKQFLHIRVGPFFSDVDLRLTRPDGSTVSPGDLGVTFDKTANSIEVTIDNAPPGGWNYEIIANLLDAPTENIQIVVDQESIVAPNAPPTLTIPPDQTVQYSDTLSFPISASDPEASDTLVLTASGLPSSLTFTDYGNRTGTVAGTAQVAAGTYPVTFSVNDGHNPPVTASLNIIITREGAIATPSSSNPISVKVNTAGGTAGPIVLKADIMEVSDGSLGDIAKATPVTCTLTPVASGAPIVITAVITGQGGGGTNTATCTTNSSVPVNVYDVNFSVGGNYYKGSADSVLTVYDPSLGFVTGGGTVKNPNNGYTANFGGNVKYLKSGQIQGSFLYIEHRPTGDVMLKSNALGSLAIVGNTAIITSKTTLSGVGNYSLIATFVDNGEPGTTDQFGLKVTDPSNVGAPDLTYSPVTLTGGNIQVPQPSKK